MYSHLYWKWDTYVELGQSIPLSFLNWGGLNLVSLQAHLFKMFGHAKFQLSISCTFKVMKVFVVYLVISTKCFITLKVLQEIESWNFACSNILKKCAWRPNFSHFGWDMTKISLSNLKFLSPIWFSSDCILNEPLLKPIVCLGIFWQRL